MQSRDEKEIRDEARRLRERGKSLSGFWISELAAAAYALDWALGKKDKAPSEDIGSTGSGHGKIAETLTKAAEKTKPVVSVGPKAAEKTRGLAPAGSKAAEKTKPTVPAGPKKVASLAKKRRS